jgi:F0F1-type ATP synthase assembly protein I
VSRLQDPKQLGIYFTLAYVGMEMVAPLVAGLILDDQFGWTPWGTVIGAALGLIGGLAHLISILNRPKNGGSPRQPRVES